MAAPSFTNASTPSTDATGGWTHGGVAVGGDTGEIVLLQVLQDGATSGAVGLTSATWVENLAGTDDTMDYIGQFPVGSPTAAFQHLWIGRKYSGSTPLFTGTNTTSEDVYVRSYQFSNVSTGTTLATVIENSTAGSTANTAATDGTITDAGVTTLGPDRLALNFVAINDDNAISDFTGETGGNWTLAVAGYAESSGTDGAIGLQIAYVGLPGLDTTIVSSGTWGQTATDKIAQQFIASGSLTSVTIPLQAVGSPSDNVTCAIQADSSGSPSDTDLVSDTTVGSTLPTGSYEQRTFSLSYSLTPGSTYWVVLGRSGSLSNADYYRQPAAARVDSYAWKAHGTGGAWGSDTSTYSAIMALSPYTGGTINGGTTTNADATDGWGVVGFALIGTTVTEVAYQPRHGYVNYQDPGVFMKAWERSRGILVPKLWTPEGGTI